MTIFFFSRAMFCTASATPEFGTSTTASTLSTSNHCRVMAAPTSTLCRWSAKITWIFLPETVPPNSSTAISAAVTEPLPVMSAVTPDISVSTPILIASVPAWAGAAIAAKAAMVRPYNICFIFSVPFVVATCIVASSSQSLVMQPVEQKPSDLIAVVFDHRHVSIAVDAGLGQQVELSADVLRRRLVRRAWMAQVEIAGDDQLGHCEVGRIADGQPLPADVETLVEQPRALRDDAVGVLLKRLRRKARRICPVGLDERLAHHHQPIFRHHHRTAEALVVTQLGHCVRIVGQHRQDVGRRAGGDADPRRDAGRRGRGNRPPQPTPCRSHQQNHRAAGLQPDADGLASLTR